MTYENLIQALILPSRLDELANLLFVNLISEPVLPVPLALSEDASLIGVDIINADGNTGAGVKVAIIDAGFDMANPGISPNIVEAISFRAELDLITGGNVVNRNHGTTVAEIIVDVALDVDLLLYNFDTTVSFANLIDYIIVEAEADIISMSLGWFNVGSYDGTNVVSQKLGGARDPGIFYVV